MKVASSPAIRKKALNKPPRVYSGSGDYNKSGKTDVLCKQPGEFSTAVFLKSSIRPKLEGFLLMRRDQLLILQMKINKV